MKFYIGFLLFWALSSVALAGETVYKCTDKYGKSFYNYEAEPKSSKQSIKCTAIKKLSAEEIYKVQKIRAVNLIAEKKYSKAYYEYIDLLRQNPLDDDVVLGLAISAEKSGRYNQAIMSYEIMQERHPENLAVLDGLARNQEFLGDKVSAESIKAQASESKLAAQTINYESAEQSEIKKEDQRSVLPKIQKAEDEKQEKTFIVRGNINTGIIYDSNANSGPSTDVLQLGNWNVFVPTAKEKETFAGYIGGGLNLAQRLSGRLWLVADMAGNIRGNENSELSETHTRTTHYLRAAAGLRYVGNKTLTDVKIKSEIFDYDLWQNVVSTGLNVLFVYATTPNLFFGTTVTAEHREYSDSKERNGSHFNLGQYIRYFMWDKRYSLTINGSLEHEDSKDNYEYSQYEPNYGYDGWRAGFGFSAKIIDTLEFSPFAQIARDFYFAPATALEIRSRRDKKVSFGVNMDYKISDRWHVNTIYTYIDNSSNSELYEFDKYVVQIGTRYEF